MSSNDPVIKVEKISKRYRLGMKEEMSDSFVASVFAFFKSPLKNYRKYRSLYKFDDESSIDDPDAKRIQSDVIWSLRDISFEINQGEVVGIIGHNGAGKSTLLKILSRITEPSSGSIEIRGRVSSLLEVGTGFHMELTGRENIYLNGTILGMKKAEVEAKFDDIVEFSGVGQFLDTPVKRYSSGMTVRLAFAVAAHLEPDILIVDEVLAVGDAEFQKKCLGKMQSVAKSGKTVLFVSHNMGAVQDLCPRSILLEGGRVIEDGDSQTVIRDYLIKLSSSVSEDIETTKDRYGNANAKIVSAKIFDDIGNITNYVVGGKTISFKFKIKLVNKVSKLRIAMTIYNHLGVGVTNFDNTMMDQEIENPNGDGEFICEVPNLPLPVGQYRVAVGVFDGWEVMDLVSNAMMFEVIRSEYYKQNIPKTSTECSCLMGHSWDYKSVRD